MTTTEISTDFAEIDGQLAPYTGTPSEQSLAALRQHVEAMALAHRLASGMVKTQLVPVRFRGKVEDATAAILYGMELGLTPIQSLQRVAVIHGMPTLEARTMVALVMRAGYMIWTEHTSDDSVTVAGSGPRGQAEEATWTIARADRAGYVPRPATPDSQRRPEVESDWVTTTKTFDGRSKTSVLGNMKYITDPQAMLYAKAAAEVCRKLAPDVLLGIPYTVEDLESEGYGEVVATRIRPARPARGVAALRERAVQARAETVDVETAHEVAADPAPAPAPEPAAKPLTPAARKKRFDRITQIIEDSGRTPDTVDEVFAVVLDRPVRRDEVTDTELDMVGTRLGDWHKTGVLAEEVAALLERAEDAAIASEIGDTTGELDLQP